MARLAGLEPTTSASAGLRSIQLSYKRRVIMVPKVRFELTRPYGHYALNVARLPFRHFGLKADTRPKSMPPGVSPSICKRQESLVLFKVNYT